MTSEALLRAAKKWKDKNPDENRRSSREAHRRKTAEDPAWYLHRLAKQSAKNRKMGFDFPLEEVRRLLLPMTCAATGIPLRWDPEIARDDFAPSLDRINNSLSYVPGNVRVVCWMYNRVRGEWADEEVGPKLRMMLEGMQR